MLLRDFIQIVHQLAPPDLAADWDNSGLQAGSPDQEIKKVGLALDATPETVAEALNAGCDVLLAHHPLIFKPLKNIIFDRGVGALIKVAAAGGLSIMAAHTNWDSAGPGVARALAEVLELTESRPLEPVSREFYKLVVFVPAGYESRMREALFAAGAGAVGDYDRCWFEASGQGGFRAPGQGRPFIGNAGEEARTRESRLEVVVPRELAERATQAVFRHHPYEEPAFEFHPIRIYGRDQGLGLIGHWDPPRDLGAELRSRFGGFRWAGLRPGLTRRVALLPGSGGRYLHLAWRQGAQALITGDVDYHTALEAAELGLTLVDLGHFETEWPGVAALARALDTEIRRRNLNVECQVLTQAPAWSFF